MTYKIKTKKQKVYSVQLKPLKTIYYYKVKAKSKAEAIRKTERLGFNVGEKLSSDNYGKIKVKSIHQIEKK